MIRTILIAAALVASATAAQADQVPWDFYETSCAPQTFGPGTCGPIFAPVWVGTLTLPGGDSVGSASGGRFTAPTVTGDGDDFSIAFGGIAGGSVGTLIGSGSTLFLTPALLTTNAYSHYLVSWTEIAGELLTVLVSYQADNGGADIGLTGGTMGSDALIGACSNGTCSVGGYWIDPVPNAVPEPGTLSLLLAGFLALMARRKAARCSADRPVRRHSRPSFDKTRHWLLWRRFRSARREPSHTRQWCCAGGWLHQ